MGTPLRRLARVAALLGWAIGAGGRAEAEPIMLMTPAGLSPGQQFRFAFVTDGTTQATSRNIGDYNTFVNAQAGGATYNGTVIPWVAIASTASVNAIDNVVRGPEQVYLADGTPVTTSTTSSGLWSGTLLHPINEDLSGVSFSTAVWTGTNQFGLGASESGAGPLGAITNIRVGASDRSDARWINAFVEDAPFMASMYAISSVLTVSSVVTAVPEPSTLLMVGTGIGAVFASGWFRRCRDQRRQRPAGPPDATG